jgi:hypothetical protein
MQGARAARAAGEKRHMARGNTGREEGGTKHCETEEEGIAFTLFSHQSCSVCVRIRWVTRANVTWFHVNPESSKEEEVEEEESKKMN